MSRKTGSRKSLAWDNAFFTSPGILDYEELSILSNGIKDGSHFLALNQISKSSSPKSKIDLLVCDVFPIGSPLDDISEDAIHGVKSLQPDSQGVALESRNEHHHERNQEWWNAFVHKQERLSFKNIEAHGGGMGGKTGSRKSLAWDNAFFNSPGILDYEELTSLSNGIKDGSHFLALDQLPKSSSPKSKIDLLGCDVFPIGSPLDDISEDARLPISHVAIHGVKSLRQDARGVSSAFPNQQGRRNAGPERNKKILPLHPLRQSQSEEKVTGTRQRKASTRRSLFGDGKSGCEAVNNIPPLPKNKIKPPPRVVRASPSQIQRPRPRTGSPLERVGSAIPKLLMLGRRKVYKEDRG